VLGGVKLDMMFLFLGGWLYSLVLYFKYGPMTLDKVEPSGPYKVGYTDKFQTKKGNFCATFYPIDAETKGKFSMTKHGYINGEGRVKAQSEVINYWEKRLPSPYEVRAHLSISVKAEVDAEISKDFEDKKLPVVIFSHGLSGSAK
jgi:hypothetical protein